MPMQHAELGSAEMIDRLAEAIGIAGQPEAIRRLTRQLSWVPGYVDDYRRYEERQLAPSAFIESVERLRRPLAGFLDAMGLAPDGPPWDPSKLRETPVIWLTNWQLVETVRGQNIDVLGKEGREGEL